MVSFADSIFDSAVKCEVDLLDRIQDRALKVIGRGQLDNAAIEIAYNIESLRTL